MDAPEVSTEDLAAASNAGAVIVDVRTTEEWETGHVPDARHIPLDELGARWQAEIPADQRIFVICAVGGRSMKAATALVEAGIDAVSVAGGTKQWAEEGRPLQ